MAPGTLWVLQWEFFFFVSLFCFVFKEKLNFPNVQLYKHKFLSLKSAQLLRSKMGLNKKQKFVG